MALEQEDVTQIGQMIALAFKDNIDIIREAALPADPEPTQPVVETETTVEPNQPFSMQDMAKAFVDQMDARDATKNENVLNVLFKEKLDSAMAATPGLSEYLDSEDDYGKKRMDQISEGTYEEKLAKLTSVSGSYAEAAAGEGGRAPIVSKKVQERVEATEKKYADIDEKMAKGDYASVNDMAADFFNTLDIELAGVA